MSLLLSLDDASIDGAVCLQHKRKIS